jgi:hypothetical protein
MPKKEDRCCLCIIFMCLCIVIVIPIFIVILLMTINNFNLEDHMCEITRVDYPTALPTFNNYNNWAVCECETDSHAWGPTVSIYTNISEHVVHYSLKTYSEQQYTFFNSSCLNGEDVRYTQIYMENAQNIAKEYINSTIPCYYIETNSSVYLYKDTNLSALISSSVILGCFVLILIGIYPK